MENVGDVAVNTNNLLFGWAPVTAGPPTFGLHLACEKLPLAACYFVSMRFLHCYDYHYDRNGVFVERLYVVVGFDALCGWL